MAFLRLNGLKIPVLADSASSAEVEIGDRSRSFDGTYRSTRRALKRQWSFSVPRRNQDLQHALRSMLLGLGDNFPFSADLFSGKGLGADTGAIVTLRGDGADGNPAPLESKFGSGSLDVSAAATNVSVITDTDTTAASWTTTDATAADISTEFFVGTGSIDIAYAAAVNSIRGEASATIIGAATAVTAYTASVYLLCKTAGTNKVRVTLKDTTNTVSSPTKVVSLDQNEWVRVEGVTLTVGALAANLDLVIEEDTVDSGIVVAVDAIQLETGVITTAYTGTSRASALLRYPPTLLEQNFAGITFSCWTRGPSSVGEAALFSAGIASPETNEFKVRSSDGVDLIFRTRGTTVSDSDDLVLSAPPWDGEWHLVTAVLNTNPNNQRHKKELYIDGGLVNSSDPDDDTLPDIAILATGDMFVGHFDGADFWNGQIDDMLVLPYAATAEQVKAWFEYTEEFPAFPSMRADGDFIPQKSTIIEGEISDEPYASFSEAGEWQNNSTEIQFTLHEV